jgi:hypothetical protein
MKFFFKILPVGLPFIQVISGAINACTGNYAAMYNVIRQELSIYMAAL